MNKKMAVDNSCYITDHSSQSCIDYFFKLQVTYGGFE